MCCNYSISSSDFLHKEKVTASCPFVSVAEIDCCVAFGSSPQRPPGRQSAQPHVSPVWAVRKNVLVYLKKTESKWRMPKQLTWWKQRWLENDSTSADERQMQKRFECQLSSLYFVRWRDGACAALQEHTLRKNQLVWDLLAPWALVVPPLKKGPDFTWLPGSALPCMLGSKALVWFSSAWRSALPLDCAPCTPGGLAIPTSSPLRNYQPFLLWNVKLLSGLLRSIFSIFNHLLEWESVMWSNLFSV